jgi:hypothetical protein
VVQRGHGARQHGGLHLATANRAQHVHLLDLWRHGGHKTQRVLPHLIRRRAQDVAKTQLVGPLGNAAGVGPTAAQVAIGYTQVLKVVRTQGGKPSHFSALYVGAFDGDDAHESPLVKHE